MYRINPLRRKVLITTDEVIFHAAFDHTIDPRSIQQAIIIAEERIIRNALCFEFYELLRNEKNVVVTSGNIATLQAQIDASLGEDSEPQILVIGDLVNAAEFLTTQHRLLWDEFLWKLTAEAVRFVSIPQNYAAMTSQGIVHNNPGIMGGGLNGGNTVTPSLTTAKWLVDKALQDSIDPLTEAMHVWLCKMKSTGMYPLYCKPCHCESDGVATQRKTGFLLNIYDEEEPNSCGCN